MTNKIQTVSKNKRKYSGSIKQIISRYYLDSDIIEGEERFLHGTKFTSATFKNGKTFKIIYDECGNEYQGQQYEKRANKVSFYDHWKLIGEIYYYDSALTMPKKEVTEKTMKVYDTLGNILGALELKNGKAYDGKWVETNYDGTLMSEGYYSAGLIKKLVTYKKDNAIFDQLEQYYEHTDDNNFEYKRIRTFNYNGVIVVEKFDYFLNDSVARYQKFKRFSLKNQTIYHTNLIYGNPDYKFDNLCDTLIPPCSINRISKDNQRSICGGVVFGGMLLEETKYYYHNNTYGVLYLINLYGEATFNDVEGKKLSSAVYKNGRPYSGTVYEYLPDNTVKFAKTYKEGKQESIIPYTPPKKLEE